MSYFTDKLHKIRFRLRLRPRLRWGSLQRSPDPLAGFKGPTSKGRGGRDGREGEERGGDGMGLEVRGRDGTGVEGKGWDGTGGEGKGKEGREGERKEGSKSHRL